MDCFPVVVLWWIHKIKGLHRNDFMMATKTYLYRAKNVSSGTEPNRRRACSKTLGPHVGTVQALAEWHHRTGAYLVYSYLNATTLVDDRGGSPAVPPVRSGASIPHLARKVLRIDIHDRLKEAVPAVSFHTAIPRAYRLAPDTFVPLTLEHGSLRLSTEHVNGTETISTVSVSDRPCKLGNGGST